jgi:hypothetical protein
MRIYLLILLSLVLPIFSAEIYLINHTQTHSNLCWASTSQSILEMYGVQVTQVSLAEWAMKMNRRDSLNSQNTLYGEPGSVSRLLAEFGNIGTVYEPKPLSYEFIKDEIDAGRPIIISVLQRPNYHTQIIYGLKDSTLLLLDPSYGYTKQEYKLYEIVCDHNLILRSNPTLSEKAYEFYNSTIPCVEFVGYTPKANIAVYDACYNQLAMQLIDGHTVKVKLMPGEYHLLISDSGMMIYKELEVR